MAYSKVILNGTTLMDVTDKTVEANKMLTGYTALKNDGTNVTGTYEPPTVSLQAKTNIAPSLSSQTITPDTGYDGLSSVQINAMPSGSATTPATTITAPPTLSVANATGIVTATISKTQSVTPSVSAGYVASGTAGNITVSGSNTLQLNTQAAATITPSTQVQTAVSSGRFTTGAVTVAAIPTGTAGTPSATKGTVSNHSVSVTPSVTNTTGYITGGTKTGTAVSVSASELVSGTKSITENGTADVTNYASVDVNVSGGGSLPGWTDISSYFDVEGTYTEYFAFTKDGCVFFYARCGWDGAVGPTITRVHVDALYAPINGDTISDVPMAIINNYNIDDSANYYFESVGWEPNMSGWDFSYIATPYDHDSEFYITIAYKYYA